MDNAIRYFTLFGLFSLSLPALAERADRDIRFVVGAAAGYTVLSFPEKLDQDVSFVSGNLLAAATYGKWQLSLNGTFSLEDADISEEEDVGKANREDIDLTLGYQINRRWSVFGGYKRGETEMDFISRDSDDEGVFIRVSESYKQEGPYLGGSFSWDFETAGRLTVSLAYADLDATNSFGANTDDDDEEDDEGEPPEFDDLSGRVKGDTTGFSYGVTWTMPLSARLLFQARLKVNDYQQDIRFEGDNYDNIDETLSSLHVGLAYVF
jgi:hypothetical protein